MREILDLIFRTTGDRPMLGWSLFIRQSCAVGGVVKPSQSLILAFVAGFVDTATFVGADGIFSAHVTGNFVLFAAALIRGLSGRDYLKLVSFPVFVVAVIITTYLYRYSRKEDRLLEKNTKLVFCPIINFT